MKGAVLEKFQTPRVLTVGIWILSAVLVMDVYDDLWEIFHFDWYRVMQADMPDWLVCVRFVISVTLRILMLWAVAGILTVRREAYRRLVLGLAWFNALTFFLHHRYPSFIYISTYLNLNTEDFLRTVQWFGHRIYLGAAARMMDAWVREFFLAFITIVFFMNPYVKRLFR